MLAALILLPEMPPFPAVAACILVILVRWGWRQEPPLLGEWSQGPSPGSQEGLSRIRTKLAGRS